MKVFIKKLIFEYIKKKTSNNREQNQNINILALKERREKRNMESFIREII